jgi:hypothetical protein
MLSEDELRALHDKVSVLQFECNSCFKQFMTGNIGKRRRLARELFETFGNDD